MGKGDTLETIWVVVWCPTGEISALSSPWTPGCVVIPRTRFLFSFFEISQTFNISWKREEVEGALFSGEEHLAVSCVAKW